MNGFLVIARCQMDDVPMHLSATRAEALEFANTTQPVDVVAEAADVNRVKIREQSTCRLVLVEFRNGIPLPMENVREFPTPYERWQSGEEGE
jgi:hypothetical protein